MLIEMCKSKIAHAFVTEAELFYEGSITIDEDLLKAVDILPGEKVDVLNINNGNRFTTYVIKGEAGSGKVCREYAAPSIILNTSESSKGYFEQNPPSSRPAATLKFLILPVSSDC